MRICACLCWHHQTYGARRLIDYAHDLEANVFRFDFDHHLTRCSVWLLGRRYLDDLVFEAASFASSDVFLDAMIPVPADPRENELREALRAAEASIRHARILVDSEAEPPA